MADIKIRKLPDWVLDIYRLHAQMSGRSLEEELRSLLTQIVLDQQRAFHSDAKALREHFYAKYGLFPTAHPALRKTARSAVDRR